MTVNSLVENSLAQLRPLLEQAIEPWWIIGSVAVALHGGEPGPISDIDVVLGHTDAQRFFRELGIPNLAPTEHPLSSSDLLAGWTGAPVKVEFMAGLKVRQEGAWQLLSIQSRERMHEFLFVPSKDELCAMLRLFGRGKDLKRAATLS